MMKNEIINRISWVPWWALSLFAAFFTVIVTAIMVNYVDESINYLVWSLLLVCFSFLISILHPARTLYIPVVCNVVIILPAVFDKSFWNTSFGLIIGTGILLSFIAAYIGGLIGRQRSKKSDN
jgi:hypothetical protein